MVLSNGARHLSIAWRAEDEDSNILSVLQEYAAVQGDIMPAAAREALEACGFEECNGADRGLPMGSHLRLREYTREERLKRKAIAAERSQQIKAAALAAVAVGQQSREQENGD